MVDFIIHFFGGVTKKDIEREKEDQEFDAQMKREGEEFMAMIKRDREVYGVDPAIGNEAIAEMNRNKILLTGMKKR